MLVLYDGVCGMCNGLVKFLIRRDHHDRYRFAALQSELGRELVRANGGDPEVLSTLYVFRDAGKPSQILWRRGRGGVIAIASVGGAWSLVHALRLLPGFVLDLGYNLIARRRYRLFGKLESCPVPPAEHRHKFLA